MLTPESQGERVEEHGSGYYALICMYVFDDRERADCPKRPYWSESRLRSKIMGKYNYLVVF